jgi:hypothetical protein
MQAEVDKFVVSHWLLRRQLPGHFPAELRRALFTRTRLDPRLSAASAAMYREASCYAERFCGRLESRLARGRGRAGAAGDDAGVLTELRRFYRLTNTRKRTHIERGA